MIRLEQVTVEYRAPRERIRTVKEYAIRLLQGGIKHDEFQALREVSFDVRQGEVFGVIGHNGAGKSTLLKVVSRVLKPTRGRVWVRGRVAPLLELGAGFHPELSGRENVFLNGTLLGFTRAQVEAIFDEIVDFAELWEFIDAPLRTYSTGMGVRLGFAVATAVRPDVLLVDEVLSVGDERFQEKCAARMTEFRQQGTTILLVTHDTRLVLSMCDRALWLDHGVAGAVGAVEGVVSAYHNALVRPESRAQKRKTVAPAVLPAADAPAATDHYLESLALQKPWFYPFDLPSGRQTECLLAPEVAVIHPDRWRLLEAALAPLCKGDFTQLSCLDLGCNQGYFSIRLAQLGCQPVVGVDARAANIQDADLMRRIYGLPQVQFRHLDLWRINPNEFGQFDVVMMFGLLYNLENPLGALRLARSLARRVVVIETQVAPDLSEPINWGNANSFKSVEGSFALVDQQGETDLPFMSLSRLALCPGREGLLAAMRMLGFARVEVLTPPPDAYEQLSSGKRICVVGYLD